MALVASSSSTTTTTQVLHHLLRPRPPPPNSPVYSLFLRPLSTSTSTKFNLTKYYQSTLFPPFSSHPTSTSTPLFFLSHSLSTSSLSFPPNTALTLHSLSSEEQEDEEEKEDDFEGEIENALLEEDDDEDEEEDEEELGLEENVKVDNGSLKVELKRSGLKVPTLTVKEKKELASYAHGLGKKLKCQLVGKSGVTSNVASSFIETLEANELLKIKIHRTCPGELDEVVQQLEEATGSVVVGQIGRTVIIYRPSLAKLKAEEKKRLARRIYVRKEAKSKPVLPSRGRVPKFSAPDRRRSTRI